MQQPVVFITGPTAVGKTDLAIDWAGRGPAGLINSDSIQAYKDLNKGSAKPDFAQHTGVDFYLFNEVSAPGVWTAGAFRKKAFQLLTHWPKDKKAFVVGGAGFYLQALEKGMYPAQVPQKNEKLALHTLSKIEQEQGPAFLYQLLQERDPETACRISPGDLYRIKRALVVIESGRGKPSLIRQEFKEQTFPWKYIKLGLRIPKDKLLKRVEQRAKKMLTQGLLEEVEQLLARGLGHWPPLNCVGYKEARLFIEGSLKKEALLPAIVGRTMALVKKQKTWAKRDPTIQWFDFDEKPLKIYKKIFK